MKQILIITVLSFLSFSLYAQVQNEATLVVSGQGSTKEEATANALRSAIEQAYGVFVSANTQILNDEIVRDEIATITSGNVKDYQELSCVTMPDGNQSVSLSATVSINNLITYAKNHGSSAEFAGQTFAMNIKLRKLNKINEYEALQNLRDQTILMASSIFNYEIKVLGEPSIDDEGKYIIDTEVSAAPNYNYYRFKELIISTLTALSMSEEEANAWKRNNMNTYCPFNGYYFRNQQAVVESILYDISKTMLVAAQSWTINVFGENEILAETCLIEGTKNNNKNLIIKDGTLPYHPNVYDCMSSPQLLLYDLDKEKRSMKVRFYFNEDYLSRLRSFSVEPNKEWYRKVIKFPIENELWRKLPNPGYNIFIDNFYYVIYNYSDHRLVGNICGRFISHVESCYDINEYIRYYDTPYGKNEIMMKILHVGNWKLINGNDDMELSVECEDKDGNKLFILFRGNNGKFISIIYNYKGEKRILYHESSENVKKVQGNYAFTIDYIYYPS